MPELMPPEAACLAAPYVADSVARSNPDENTLEEVLEAIGSGEARLWMGEKSAAVTTFLQNAVVRADEAVWHAGGELRDLLDVLDFGADACREAGCDRLVIENTRPGWERVLKARGFRAVTVLVKEL